MELNAYLRIIRLRWWVVLATAALATLATVLLVVPQPSIYQSTGTMLIRPIAGTETNAIDAQDLLVRGVKTGSTYATVAQSDLILQRAKALVGPAVDTSGVTVSAELVTDTNIVSISVRGTDPVAAQALASAIQKEMASYVASVDETYALVPVDEPNLPRKPVAPNKMLTIAVGMFFGLAAGVGLVLVEEYVRGATNRSSVASVVDPRTGLHSEAYMRERLLQEMSRAERTGHGFSFAILRLALVDDDDDPAGALRKREIRRIGQALSTSTPPDWTLGYLEAGTYAAVLPEVPRGEAEELLLTWESTAAAAFHRNGEGSASRLRLSTGTCQYHDRRFLGDREAMHVAAALVGENGERGPGEGTPTGAEPREAAAPSAGASSGRRGTASIVVNDPTSTVRRSTLVADPSADVPGDPRRRRLGGKGNGRAGERAG